MREPEKSCGAVVYRMEKGRRLYLLLHYCEGHWDLPKGHVEAGESEEQTARREISEETHSPAVVANLNDQVQILHRRARILRLSITFAAVTVLCVGVLILGLFVAALGQIEMAAALVAIFCVAVLLYQDQVARVIAWATVGVYIVYQMVVFASMYARAKGWPKERAHFNLGKWGWPVSIIAFAYGVFMIVNLSWPRAPGK